VTEAPRHTRHRGSAPPLRRELAVLAAGLSAVISLSGACLGDLPTLSDTVDLGDHFEAPDRRLDEDFFHCVIQPEVITEYGCATGSAADGGGCHLERSALRLVEVDEPPRCDDGVLLGQPPLGSQNNLDRVRASVGVDAESSPLYRRPVALDSHPRQIFDESSEAAQLLRDWIEGGTQ